MNRFFVCFFVWLLVFGFVLPLFVVGQVDSSVISMSGSGWSLKVDGILNKQLDSSAIPSVSVKSVSSRELLLSLASLKDCVDGKVEFKVQTQGLSVYKQLPLDEEIVVDGVRYDFVNGTHGMLKGNVVTYRPIEYVNSFACFDGSGGKVLHVSASKLVDAKGDYVWVDSDLKDGLLTVYLDSKFLESAVFPVLVDPTFGYTSIGGSNTGLGGAAGKFACRYELTENVTVEYITVYGSGMGNIQLALYSDNSGSIDALLGVTDVISGSSLSWHTGTMASLYNASVGYYWLACVSDALDVNGWYYDTGVSNQGIWAWGNTLSDPFGSGTQTTHKISIYANYTVIVSPTPTPTPTPSPSPTSTATPSPTPSSGTFTLVLGAGDWVLVFEVVMVGLCFVGLYFFKGWFGNLLSFVVGLFAFIIGLYTTLSGLWSESVILYFGLFVVVVAGFCMLYSALGLRVSYSKRR